MLIRFFIYGLLGWAAEILWTGLPKKRPIDWNLEAHTQWWTFPIYGQMATLYEPLHNRIRNYPWWARGFLYGCGFIGVEYLSGEIANALIGKVPWDYAPKTRWHYRGMTRVDYFPLWFGFGLLMEPVHDYLVRLTPWLKRARNE